MSSSLDLQAIHDFAVTLARSAGALIKEGSATRYKVLEGANVDIKKNRVDLVTETDQGVEKFVKDALHHTYPGHSFIGEESFAAGEKGELTDAPTWIVDPIDGTTNFVHGFDFVCISIGFVVDRQPVIGIIYAPFLDRLYSAITGKGAFLNQTIPLPLSYPVRPPLHSLGDALVGVEWGSDRSKKVIDKKARTFSKLAGDGKEIEGGVMVHSMRSVGSAALNYAMVAAGQLDLYWEIGCWAWDVAAGVVIATEAGGKCYGKGGVPMDTQGKDLMGHHFFVVRSIGDTTGETGEQAQDRIAKEFFSVAEEWDA